jgi:hypothetical protein
MNLLHNITCTVMSASAVVEMITALRSKSLLP